MVQKINPATLGYKEVSSELPPDFSVVDVYVNGKELTYTYRKNTWFFKFDKVDPPDWWKLRS